MKIFTKLSKVIDVIVFLTSQLFKTKYKGL